MVNIMLIWMVLCAWGLHYVYYRKSLKSQIWLDFQKIVSFHICMVSLTNFKSGKNFPLVNCPMERKAYWMII